MNEKEKAQAIEKQFANVNKNQSELLARAYGIAESHFYSDDECTVAWQPFEDFDDDELSAQVNDLAESIYQAMLWAQGGTNEN
jgi:hypothetical protein